MIDEISVEKEGAEVIDTTHHRDMVPYMMHHRQFNSDRRHQHMNDECMKDDDDSDDDDNEYSTVEVSPSVPK